MKVPLPIFLTGALLGVLVAPSGALGQLVAEPRSLSVTAPQGAEAERTITLTNIGSEAVAFCVNFERPLQREAAELRLDETAVGTACGEIGEVLFYVDEEDFGMGWSPYGLAMTPDGRLFAADQGLNRRTHELTPGLEVLRSFEHPTVAEVSTFPETRGVTYNPETGRLWWLNIEEQGQDFRRALLLEGDLDGTPTGRRIELPTHRSKGDTLYPLGLSFDLATHRFYTVGGFIDGPSVLWAVDTLGTVVPGYPVGQTAYPGALALGFGPDAHGGANPDGAPSEPEAVRVELTPIPAGGSGFDRIVVVTPEGAGLGLETPLPDVSGGTGFGSIEGEPLRSRIDPNGVLYFPFVNFETEGVVGIRPHPLPPSWLALSQWDGTLEPGESVEIMLTFSSGTRAVGNTYEAALQVFEAETGAATEVPLRLEVAPPVGAEDEPIVPTEVLLSVWPNPTTGRATLAVVLPERAHLRLAVYDVLGRRVALLADERTEAGQHRFSFDGRALPAGVYLVRATSGSFTSAQSIVVTQ